jgi:hypothetical protein
MADATGLARDVFAAFWQGYEEHAGDPSMQWWIEPLGDEDRQRFYPTLSDADIGRGIRILKQKGLIKQLTQDGYQLDEAGEECCLHPELFDEYVAPRRAAVVPNVSISGGNVQFGDGNTQNITYGALLHEALQIAEEREDVPAPVAAALKRLQAFPDIESLMSEAAERLAAK